MGTAVSKRLRPERERVKPEQDTQHRERHHEIDVAANAALGGHREKVGTALLEREHAAVLRGDFVKARLELGQKSLLSLSVESRGLRPEEQHRKPPVARHELAVEHVERRLLTLEALENPPEASKRIGRDQALEQGRRGQRELHLGARSLGAERRFARKLRDAGGIVGQKIEPPREVDLVDRSHLVEIDAAAYPCDARHRP